MSGKVVVWIVWKDDAIVVVAGIDVDVAGAAAVGRDVAGIAFDN